MRYNCTRIYRDLLPGIGLGLEGLQASCNAASKGRLGLPYAVRELRAGSVLRVRRLALRSMNSTGTGWPQIRFTVPTDDWAPPTLFSLTSACI